MSAEQHMIEMSTGPRITEPDMFPEPYPWCLACGFQHQDNEHCAECSGDHSAGYCMTPELADELARVERSGLRQRVEREAEPLVRAALDVLFDQVVNQ